MTAKTLRDKVERITDKWRHDAVTRLIGDYLADSLSDDGVSNPGDVGDLFAAILEDVEETVRLYRSLTAPE